MSIFYLHLIHQFTAILESSNFSRKIFNKIEDENVQRKIKCLKILKQAKQIKIKAFKQRILF